jgi:hypothetical protein
VMVKPGPPAVLGASQRAIGQPVVVASTHTPSHTVVVAAHGRPPGHRTRWANSTI